jgi:hypothetical protein
LRFGARLALPSPADIGSVLAAKAVEFVFRVLLVSLIESDPQLVRRFVE